MEEQWQDVSLGADVPQHSARLILSERGSYLHGWLKFRAAGGQAYMVTMTIDMKPIEDALASEIESKSPGAVSGGRLGRKIKGKLKKAVKKIASNKLVKGIVKVAKKALDNPLLKGVLAATPMGASLLAVRAAAKVAAKAVKGSQKAKNFMRNVAQRVRQGDRGALQTARLLKQGIKAAGISRGLSLPASASAGSEEEFLSTVLGACVDCYHPHAISGASEFMLVAGDDADEMQEIETVDTIATSGAFEGVRWAANRLGLHSMVARPDEFTTRNALMLGHSAMSAARN